MYRKDSIIIEEWLKSSDKALLVTGARQIGKLIVDLDMEGL